MLFLAFAVKGQSDTVKITVDNEFSSKEVTIIQNGIETTEKNSLNATVNNFKNSGFEQSGNKVKNSKGQVTVVLVKEEKLIVKSEL